MATSINDCGAGSLRVVELSGCMYSWSYFLSLPGVMGEGRVSCCLCALVGRAEEVTNSHVHLSLLPSLAGGRLCML